MLRLAAPFASTILGELGKPEVLEGLRLGPGVSLVQTGTRIQFAASR